MSPDHVFILFFKITYISNILQFFVFSLELDGMNGKLSNDISESTQQIHSQNGTHILLGWVVERIAKFYFFWIVVQLIFFFFVSVNTGPYKSECFNRNLF